MQNILTADIGGSKTLLRVYGPDGGILWERAGIGFGLAVESDADIPALGELLAPVREMHIGAAAVNLGGRNKGQIAAIFRRMLPEARLSVFRESEGTAALALGASLGARIVLLAGTGSIAVADDDGRVIIAGGWGANIGDDGSGYAVGLAAIRHSLRALDCAGELSGLAKRLMGLSAVPQSMDAADYCALRDTVRGRLGPFERREIASKARIVGELAAEGEPVSLAILADAGRDLGALVGEAGKRLAADAPLSVAVTGGLIHIRAYWQDAFEAAVRARMDAGEFFYVPDGVISGTYEIAKRLI
ncbi:MAG: hypothetical protein IJF67_06580 [Clostridia bacterium]|nr:hypothetical protein [Clostridia bacterium]